MVPERTSEPQRGLRSALSVPSFRALLAAQTLSSLGDELARLALAVVVFSRTGSPLLTAATLAVSVLPWLLLGPRLATLGDRYPRRAVLVTCDLTRVGLALGLAAPGLPIWLLLALVALLTAAEPPFDATRAALLADLLEGEDYVAGQALMQTVVSLLTVVGYGVGGLVVVALGGTGALLLDAASFLVSALLLLGVRAPAIGPPPTAAAGPARRRRTGWGLVLHDPRLRWLLGLSAATALFDVVPVGLVVPWAHELAGGARTAGLLAAARPLGLVVASLLVVRVLSARRRLSLLPWWAVGSVALLALALLGPPTADTLLVLVGSGLCGVYQLVANQLFVQAAPVRERAAAFGVAGSVLYGTQGVGLLTAGLLAEHLAPHLVVGLAGAAGGVVVAALLVTRPAALRPPANGPPPPPTDAVIDLTSAVPHQRTPPGRVRARGLAGRGRSARR